MVIALVCQEIRKSMAAANNNSYGTTSLESGKATIDYSTCTDFCAVRLPINSMLSRRIKFVSIRKTQLTPVGHLYA